MTTATEPLAPPSSALDVPSPRVAPASKTLRRFLDGLAIASAMALLLLGAAFLAYDAAYDGRVVPGVHVGAIDLSGLDRDEGAAALEEALAGLGDGRLVIDTPFGTPSIAFRDVARRPDVDAMLAEAMIVGRVGSPAERAVSLARAALNGAPIAPRVTLDDAALRDGVARALTRLERPPVDAAITMRPSGIVTSHSVAGRRFDAAPVQAAALDALGRVDAPAEVVVTAVPVAVPPELGDPAVAVAAAGAGRMLTDVVVTDGEPGWTIEEPTIRSWIRFEYGPAGAVRPVADRSAIETDLATIAAEVARKPVSATFLVGKDGTVVGVTRSVDGRVLDPAATALAIARELAARAAAEPPAPVPAVVSTIAPTLTTEEAQEVAPLMTRLGSWKTWFPVGERNYWGANIWLPAKAIDGTVLEPGETFEWFRAVGPITSARGYGPGGVIDGDHTDPTGALGGGMCSSSTTLFNAALRAGLQMGERASHIYYIDRYPLGLDATVWKIGAARRTVTFTNDMDHPILIRGFRYRDSAGRGWVRYEIWGIPDGRTVGLSKPVVTNVRAAMTRVVQVSTLPTGVRRQTEYPVNGMDVSVTRTVRDRDGRVIHQETYRSHYQLWDGRIEVGVAG